MKRFKVEVISIMGREGDNDTIIFNAEDDETAESIKAFHQAWWRSQNVDAEEYRVTELAEGEE